MKKQWSSIILMIFLLLLVAACSNDDQASESNSNENEVQVPEIEEPEEVEEPEPEPEEPEFENIHPLTGIPTNDSVDNRTIGVMINNHPKARPQSGLTKADVVFEILSEYNITRFLALFQSEQPEVVGPVRSARPYYWNLADSFNALYIYHGAATQFENKLRAGIVDNLNGAYYDNDKHLFKREDFRVAPHNSYLLLGAAYEVAEENGLEVTYDHKALSFLSEEEVTAISGDPATEISYSYTSTPTRYTYDTSTEKYSRFNGDMQTVELDTEEPVQLDNLFILETHHEVVDSSGRREIDFESGGDAYLFQKGKMQEVQWKNVDGKILPYDGDTPVGLVPGKTWINVIPNNPGLEAVTIK
ncbi:DUF3048 domain-containing protein [Radiobacillus sp. PE A8.2]|uniref:DUF3048 domain-containing protein n=1 Tax=Radiobacillus sp. PE A8.2 TaxID=3380349 RepID=UPI00388D6809